MSAGHLEPHASFSIDRKIVEKKLLKKAAEPIS
jgi:hypothetical protein